MVLNQTFPSGQHELNCLMMGHPCGQKTHVKPLEDVADDFNISRL